MSVFDALILLEQPVPVWRIGSDGRILAANELALWLWDLQAHRGSLREANAFDIFERNFDRIPLEQNSEFWTAKLRTERDILGDSSSPFDKLRKRSADFKELANNLTSDPPGEVWRYSLRIRTPGQTSETYLLRLETTVTAVETEDHRPAGYVAEYQPAGAVERLAFDTVPGRTDRYSSGVYTASGEPFSPRAVADAAERDRIGRQRTRSMLSERKSGHRSHAQTIYGQYLPSERLRQNAEWELRNHHLIGKGHGSVIGATSALGMLLAFLGEGTWPPYVGPIVFGVTVLAGAIVSFAASSGRGTKPDFVSPAETAPY